MAEKLSYGEKEYWEQQYEKCRERSDFKEYRFDWYLSFKGIFREMLLEHIPKTKNEKILHLGSGNSSLEESLWKEGWTNITNIDYCKNVIDDMRQQCIPFHGLQFILMDCRNMSQFAEASFDVIIEKGTLDTVFCSLSGVDNARKAISEIFRVLKPGGRLVSISCATPKCRKHHFQNLSDEWSVDTYMIPVEPGIYIYACTKRPSHHLATNNINGISSSHH